jgi:hypothetical protein
MAGRRPRRHGVMTPAHVMDRLPVNVMANQHINVMARLVRAMTGRTRHSAQSRRFRSSGSVSITGAHD